MKNILLMSMLLAFPLVAMNGEAPTEFQSSSEQDPMVLEKKLVTAAFTGDLEACNDLMKRDVSQSAREFALVAAARKGSENGWALYAYPVIVEALLKTDVSNAAINYAFYEATQNNHLSVAMALISHEIDCHVKFIAYNNAKHLGFVDIVNLIRSHITTWCGTILTFDYCWKPAHFLRISQNEAVRDLAFIAAATGDFRENGSVVQNLLAQGVSAFAKDQAYKLAYSVYNDDFISKIAHEVSPYAKNSALRGPN